MCLVTVDFLQIQLSTNKGPGSSSDLLVDLEVTNAPRFVNTEIGTTTRNLLFRDFMPDTPFFDTYVGYSSGVSIQ